MEAQYFEAALAKTKEAARLKKFPMSILIFLSILLGFFILGLMLKMRPDMVGWKGFEVTGIGPPQKGFTVANWKREKFDTCTPVAIPPPTHSTSL